MARRRNSITAEVTLAALIGAVTFLPAVAEANGEAGARERPRQALASEVTLPAIGVMPSQDTVRAPRAMGPTDAYEVVPDEDDLPSIYPLR